MTGSELIATERLRQIQEEGWTEEHDKAVNNPNKLVHAAVCYCLKSTGWWLKVKGLWPWGGETWKPKDKLRDWVRAGALIAAAIDRLAEESQ